MSYKTSLMVLAFGAVVLSAQTPTPAAQPAAGTVTLRENGSPIVSENTDERLKTPISLTAQEASLPEVMRVLSQRSRMNFVSGEGVRAEKITIILDKTPLDEAVDLIVRAAGLSYEIIGNSILIAAPDKLKEEVGRSAYVIRLRYANAPEVAGFLGDLTKNIKVDEGGNKLVCYTSPHVINEIERIVKSVDHPSIQVMLETRLMEVSMDKLVEYGIDWSNFTPIVTGIDHPQTPLLKGYSANQMTLRPLNINLILNLLGQKGDARILMDSKLATTNNRQASLHIGEVVPYVVQSYNLAAGGGGGNQEVKKEEVGVKLTMTPQVNDDKEITLLIEPEVSSIVGWKGQNQDIPYVRVRKTKTSVRVKDGQTIFLAGLISEEKALDIRKLPLLGDIPLLGRLFQKRKEIMRKSNLIVEITPRIVTDPSMLTSGGQESNTDSKK